MWPFDGLVDSLSPEQKQLGLAPALYQIYVRYKMLLLLKNCATDRLITGVKMLMLKES